MILSLNHEHRQAYVLNLIGEVTQVESFSWHHDAEPGEDCGSNSYGMTTTVTLARGHANNQFQELVSYRSRDQN